MKTFGGYSAKWGLFWSLFYQFWLWPCCGSSGQFSLRASGLLIKNQNNPSSTPSPCMESAQTFHLSLHKRSLWSCFLLFENCDWSSLLSFQSDTQHPPLHLVVAEELSMKAGGTAPCLFHSERVSAHLFHLAEEKFNLFKLWAILGTLYLTS